MSNESHYGVEDIQVLEGLEAVRKINKMFGCEIVVDYNGVWKTTHEHADKEKMTADTPEQTVEPINEPEETKEEPETETEEPEMETEETKEEPETKTEEPEEKKNEKKDENT